MRIGLIRHFPVEEPFPCGWLTARCIQEWLERYNTAGVRLLPLDVGPQPWPRCLSSDMSRAYTTALAAHRGEIRQTPLLREPTLHPLTHNDLRLPFWGWRWLLRAAWTFSHPTQQASRREFEQRVLAVADLLESDVCDTLVVSHAGMMAYLRKELLKRGFSGPRFGIAEHARLYEFRRE